MDFYPGTDIEFANLPRETQVIWLAMEGNTDKTIAQLLEITTDTVATYWKRILVKYDSSSRTEVIAEFLREYYEGDLDHLESKVTELEEKIRARSVAEQHQLLATAQLNSLMNLLDVGVLFTTNGLKVNYINEQLCRMAGCSLTPKGLIGSDISTFVENCKFRALKNEDSTAQRIKTIAASNRETAIDQIHMTNGRILERTFCNVMVRGTAIGHFIVYKDVTPFVDETRELIQKSKLSEQIIQRTLVHFESLDKDQPRVVVDTLSTVAKIIGADLAVVAEANFKKGTFSVLYSWEKNKLDTSREYDETVPLTFVDWFRKQMAEKDYWIIDSAGDLPKSATMERAIFEESGVRSAVALCFDGVDPDKKYFVQFGSQREKQWDQRILAQIDPLRKLLVTVLRKCDPIKGISVE